MTPPLAILRGHERAAWLSGPRAVIDAIAAASGLVARDCADDRARVIEHAHEDAGFAGFGGVCGGEFGPIMPEHMGAPEATAEGEGAGFAGFGGVCGGEFGPIMPEHALAAACVAAGYASPPRACTLCDASERGACVVHRRPVVDCARCGTRHYGPTPPACVFCGAVFSVPRPR